MPKAIICGGRNYRDRERVDRILSAAAERLGLDAIVQGGQVTIDEVTGEKYGADWLAKEWAKAHRMQCETYYADWKGLGRAAGPIRNSKMLESGAEICLCFPGGDGTDDMARKAKKAGLMVVRC